MVISLWLLGLAMRTIPVGTAYPVWVGIGALGTVLLGMILFAETMTLWRGLSVALIVLGVAGLSLAGEASP